MQREEIRARTESTNTPSGSPTTAVGAESGGECQPEKRAFDNYSQTTDRSQSQIGRGKSDKTLL